MAEETAGERTEQATPRKRDKAREKGQVAKSNEVNSFFVLLAGAVMLLATSGYMLNLLSRNTRYLLGQAHFLAPSDYLGVKLIVDGNVMAFGKVLAPLAGLILVAGLVANVLQVGLKLTPSAMDFKWDRLNPFSGIKRMFQKKTFFELGKNILKIGLISLLSWLVIRSMMPQFTSASDYALPWIVDLGRAGYVKLMAILLGFLGILAIFDWAFQKHQHDSELKMSLQEVKEEMKEMEGDPQIKARIRALQMEASRKRMLADVPRADVVVTNPTHFAVALKYEAGKAAPIVLAKGADFMAKRIRETAKEHRVPVIENKPVARALYAECEIGQTIPERLFQAVAEILAYVYRLKKA